MRAVIIIIIIMRTVIIIIIITGALPEVSSTSHSGVLYAISTGAVKPRACATPGVEIRDWAREPSLRPA